ncbi:phosphatidate cytidylyltransferase [Devosia sp.]|uniref:phosphatidate cytidylyltransferase n=1 Tax=Devosia sp. TaxID=1871048 RepID=UPI003A90DEFC
MNEPAEPRPSFTPLARRSWTDLGPRVISGLVLVSVALILLYVGGYLFAALIGAVFAGCYREWERMVTLKPITKVGMVLIGILALSAVLYPALGPLVTLFGAALAIAVIMIFGRTEPRLWRIGGLAFYGIVILMVLQIRGTSAWLLPEVFDAGLWAGLFLAAIIWMTDIGAYFAGRQVGGEKLAPDISPSKTWSGAIGGLAVGTLSGLVVWLFVAQSSPWWVGLLLAALTSVFGQIGDLAESALKRRFRIKDSGDIIPGHGGLMDRLDSLTFGAIFLFMVGTFHPGAPTVAAGILFW